MRCLIVGGSGFLGREIRRQAHSAGDEVSSTYNAHRPEGGGNVAWHRLDVTDRSDVHALLAKIHPDVVVNAAFRQDSWAATADGAAHVALAAAAVGAHLVHVSSDAVFAGSPRPYKEMSDPAPLTPYGAAKAAAETAVRAIAPTAVVARTSLILGDGLSVHERHVLDLAHGRSTGVLFTDEKRCPIHVGDLAAALLELTGPEHSGIAHVVGADAVDRYGLGRLIARRAGLDPDVLRPGRRADSALPGPVDVRLDCTRTQARLNTRLRGARQYLAHPSPS